MITLSKHQTQAYDAIMKWYNDKKNYKPFVLSGYSGTGKTSLARHLADNLNTKFLAYTGKAVNVLKEKGCFNSDTIHSHLYRAYTDKHGVLSFKIKEREAIVQADLLILDEYSMIPDEMRHDLESFSKKILYIGDNFQLPPINGKCNLDIDFQLTEVHRQALDSNIIRIVTDIRDGIWPKYCNYDDFCFARMNALDKEIFLKADQILVGRNKTRIEWTNKYRKHKKINIEKNPFPLAGEKLICLQNNKYKSLFNGMIGKCKKDVIGEMTSKYINIDFEKHKKLKVSTDEFLNKQSLDQDYNKSVNKFYFGYVITVHKAQGSEWDNVLVNEEPIGKSNIEQQRWLYTALTRARKKVWLVN